MDGPRLWAGAVAAAATASVVVVAGLLTARALLGIDLLSPPVGQPLGDDVIAGYLLAVWVGTGVAAAVLHTLVPAAPQPLNLFGWLATLTVTLAALLPALGTARSDLVIATVLVNVVTVATAGILLCSVAARAMRWIPTYPKEFR